MSQFEKTFVVAVPRSRAWRAFADGAERSQWEATEYEIDPRPGGALRWVLPGLECIGEVLEVEHEKLLRHVERTGPHDGTEVTVRLEDAEGGTRITITHAGFGGGTDFEESLESTTLGWTQAIADLLLYLEYGLTADRFVRPVRHPGMFTRDTPVGLEVAVVQPGGYAEQAGLRRGDLVLTLAGAPVYTAAELWVLMRLPDLGDKPTVEYARDGQRLSGIGAL